MADASCGTGRRGGSPKRVVLRHLISQFMRPRGVLGRMAGWTMAARYSNRRRNRWTVDLMALDPSDHVLEIGFGPGLALAWVCAALTDGWAVGLDHSRTMHDMAYARNREAVAHGRLHLRTGSVEDLGSVSDPVLDGPFDHIYAVNVAMFWRDAAAVLVRLGERLCPGGRIYLTLQPRSGERTGAAAVQIASRLTDHLRAAGLAPLRVERLDELKPPAVCVIAEKSPAGAGPGPSLFGSTPLGGGCVKPQS